MEQIEDKAPFFCIGLDHEEVVLPVFGEEMKSESLDFCVRMDAEFAANAPTEEKCLSSDRSDFAGEPSVHADVKEISLSSNTRVNEPTGEASSSTELLTDAWDNLTYDGTIVSFECEQGSWKLENFDDEQFDCLMSQYVPAIVDNGASAITLKTEAHDNEITNGTNSVCLSSVGTGLSEMPGMDSGKNTTSIGEYDASRTSGDKNICTAQQPSTLGHTESNLIGDNNTRETNLLCYEKFQSGDKEISYKTTGSGSDLIRNEKFEQNSNLTIDKENQSINAAKTTETNLMCDEQFVSSDSTGSSSDVIQNEKCKLDSNKENQFKNMAKTTEANLLCEEQFESSDSTGPEVIQVNGKHDINVTSDKDNQSKYMVKTTEHILMRDEQFESSDSAGSGLDVMQNTKSMHYSNTTSDKENQSKNMANASMERCDAIRVISGSRLPPWDKNDEILSCESYQNEALEPVLPCSLNSDSGYKNADALPISELTSSDVVYRPGADVVRKESSQTTLTIDDIGSFIEIVRAASSSKPQPVCSNPCDLLATNKDLPNRENAKIEGHETHFDKNCKPLRTEFGSHLELLDSENSNEEVLLLEYANQEEAGSEGSKGIIPSEKIKKSLSNDTSKDEDVLRSGNHMECCDQVLPSANITLSVTDSSEMPPCGSAVVHDQLSSENSYLQMEDPVVSLDITSSITVQMYKDTSDVVEMTALAHQGEDLMQKDMKDSFNVVHTKNSDGLTSERVSADESTSNVHESTRSDECGSGDGNNTLTPKRGHQDHSIVVAKKEDSPLTDSDIDSALKHMKQEKPWTFGDEASAGEYLWKDPVPHGLKECFCPHGIVSVQAGHFHCQECGFSSVYKNSIMRHEVMKHRVKHTLIKIIQCRLCPSIFVRSRDFRSHSQKHAQNIVSSCQGIEQRSSDSEIPQQDSSITPSSESPSSSRRNSLSRGRRSSIGWNWKVAFDFKTHMEQRAKKRKSDQMTSSQKSPAVKDKPDESFNFKLVKQSNKNISEGEMEKTEISYYDITEMSADGVKTTVKRPCYDGVLLASLTLPSNSCPICYKKFTKVIVQKCHYAQVHKIYLQGISLFQCTPCGIRTVSLHDFEIHIRTGRHQALFNKLNVSGSAVTSPLAGCDASSLADKCTAVSDRSESGTRKRQSSNGVYTGELRPSKKIRRSSSGEKRNSHKVRNNWQTLQRTESGRFKKAEAEVAKDISTEKIKWFYGSTKRNCPSPEIRSNACVLNHVCTATCVCGMPAKDKMASKKKPKKSMIPNKKCSEGIGSESPSMSFQPVIVDSFSCLPSMWTNISAITSDDNKSVEDNASKNLQFDEKSCKTEPDKELPSQFASNTTRALRFFQSTRRTVFTSSLQNTLKPQEIVPQMKPRSQVALKSTSQQTNRRLNYSAEEKASKPDETNDIHNSYDLKKITIIHVSDDEGDSSHSATVALDSGCCKIEVGTIRSESTAGCWDQVRSKTNNCDDFYSANVRQSNDTSICSRSENRRSASTASTSRSVDVTPPESSVLSDFHSDVLCNELQKRGFMKRCTCGVFFLGLPTYNLHCAWHLSGSPLSCSFCKAVTKDWYEFYSHIQNHCK